jgi:hypothetical protein
MASEKKLTEELVAILEAADDTPPATKKKPPKKKKKTTEVVPEEETKMGRPKILVERYKTADKFQEVIEKYFFACKYPEPVEYTRRREITDKKTGKVTWKEEKAWDNPKEKLPTIGGLSLFLKIDSDVLNDYLKYKDVPDFSRTIKMAFRYIETAWQQSLTTKNATGVIFNLKNNWGWQDKSEVLTKNVDINERLREIEQAQEYIEAEAKE